MHPTFSRVLLAAALAAAGNPAVATEIQLEQGWNAEQRASWYDASLGSRLLPLAWAQALERPNSEERLFSEDNARRLGFPLRNWQGGELRLPRGFALDQQDDSQFSDTRLRWKARQSSSEPWVGLNCAGCHSTDISYRGSELTVDAGATLANVQAIFDEVLAALRRTSDDGDKFARFAGNVLGSEDSPANRELLKAALVKRAALIDTLLSMSATDLQPGPGRLDATGQSLNRAAINSGARHLQANPTDAPTSFPALWHTLQMDKLQSSGFVPNVKVLDLNGQVFDLGYLAGDIGVVQGDYGDVVSHPLSGLEGYISSIRVDNLTRVEGLIHKLKAPAWPSQLFGAPDSARLARQAPLRGELRGLPCEHRPRRPANPDQGPPGAPEGPWRRRADRHRPVDGLQHLHLQQPSGNYFGLFRPSLGTPSGVGIVGRTSKIADMQVPEVFQIMLGKKGQLADGIAEIIHAIVTGQQTLPGSDSLQAVPAGQLLLAGAAPADSQAQSLTAGEVPTDKSARKDYCLNTEHPFLGYIARPLNGIWATAPYLHNGSVPSLYDLLLPQEQRPATFYTGSHEFDPSRVGYLTAPGPDNAFLFDTHLEGNSNAGHDFAREYDESQRLALLEYLKTL